MAHLVRGCCALLLALLSLPGSAMWFGDNLGVHRVDTTTDRIDLDISSDLPLAIAVNGNDGSAWVLTQEDIVQYGRDGAMRFRAALGTLLPGLGASRLLALDPRDGGVWLGGERRLARLSASGTSLVRLDVSATDLGVAQDGALWVLLQGELRRYAADGALIQSTPLSAADRQAKYLALDDTGGALWLAGEKRLAKRSLADPSEITREVTAAETLSALSIDLQTGALWVTGQQSLFGYARQGNRFLSPPMASPTPRAWSSTSPIKPCGWDTSKASPSSIWTARSSPRCPPRPRRARWRSGGCRSR